MLRTWHARNTPARRRRPSGFRRWMRDEKAGGCCFARRKAKAARRRQLDLVEHADDDGEARSLEAFFERVQSLACPRRLDDEQPRRVEAEMREACRRRRSEFAGKRLWPAPQHPRVSRPRWATPRQGARGSHLGKRIEPAHRETRCKADCRHPIPGRGATKGGRRSFDFVNRIRFEAARQQFVERRTAKPPTPPARRRPGIIGLRRRAPTRRMPLQAQNARAEPRDHRGFHGCGRSPDRRYGPSRSVGSYRGKFRGEIRCGDWDSRGHKEPQD